jgi:hypothetical protein
MKLFSPALWTLALLFLATAATADDTILEIKGKAGPGKGKTIVLVSGDEEYRSEECMPMLAKILAVKHGFDCKVLFAWDKGGKYIDPNNQQGIKGWQHLKTADLMIIGTRFRRPNAEDAKHITAFLDAGKPIIGIRTATHGFTGGGKFGSLGYGSFGPKILGEGWAGHHGGHKRQGARGVIVKANADHPILRGVSDVFAPSDVYGVRRLTDVDKILLRGAVTATLDPASKIIEGKKNKPMQPSAWLHPYKSPSGTKGTSLCTTMGASVDLVSEDLRRLLVNGAYHLTGLEVPKKADVAYVDPFYPSFYGFINDKSFWPSQNLRPADFGLGKSPALPDPKGSPKWNFRPTKK